MNVILWTKLFVYNHVTKTKFSQFYLFYAHVTMIIRQTKVELFKLISIFIWSMEKCQNCVLLHVKINFEGYLQLILYNS